MAKQQQETYLWSCDFKGCKAHATSFDERDTPDGWTTFDGAMQEPSGGGPAAFDLCSKHSAKFHRTYHVHCDIDEEKE